MKALREIATELLEHENKEYFDDDDIKEVAEFLESLTLREIFFLKQTYEELLIIQRSPHDVH